MEGSIAPFPTKHQKVILLLLVVLPPPTTTPVTITRATIAAAAPPTTTPPSSTATNYSDMWDVTKLVPRLPHDVLRLWDGQA